LKKARGLVEPAVENFPKSRWKYCATFFTTGFRGKTKSEWLVVRRTSRVPRCTKAQNHQKEKQKGGLTTEGKGVWETKKKTYSMAITDIKERAPPFQQIKEDRVQEKKVGRKRVLEKDWTPTGPVGWLIKWRPSVPENPNQTAALIIRKKGGTKLRKRCENGTSERNEMNRASTVCGELPA